MPGTWLGGDGIASSTKNNFQLQSILLFHLSRILRHNTFPTWLLPGFMQRFPPTGHAPNVTRPYGGDRIPVRLDNSLSSCYLTCTTTSRWDTGWCYHIRQSATTNIFVLHLPVSCPNENGVLDLSWTTRSTARTRKVMTTPLMPPCNSAPPYSVSCNA
jgi:hypothetical protein